MDIYESEGSNILFNNLLIEKISIIYIHVIVWIPIVFIFLNL